MKLPQKNDRQSKNHDNDIIFYCSREWVVSDYRLQAYKKNEMKKKWVGEIGGRKYHDLRKKRVGSQIFKKTLKQKGGLL